MKFPDSIADTCTDHVDYSAEKTFKTHKIHATPPLPSFCAVFVITCFDSIRNVWAMNFFWTNNVSVSGKYKSRRYCLASVNCFNLNQGEVQSSNFINFGVHVRSLTVNCFRGIILCAKLISYSKNIMNGNIFLTNYVNIIFISVIRKFWKVVVSQS